MASREHYIKCKEKAFAPSAEKYQLTVKFTANLADPP